MILPSISVIAVSVNVLLVRKTPGAYQQTNHTPTGPQLPLYAIRKNCFILAKFRLVNFAFTMKIFELLNNLYCGLLVYILWLSTPDFSN